MKIRSTLFETSVSASGNKCGASSTIVVSTPKFEKILAHSIPIAPEPTIKTDFGNSERFRISSDDKMNLWSNSNPLTVLGFEPIAEIICFTWYCSPFASMISFFDVIFASQFTTVTFEFLRANSIPFLNFSMV